MGEQEKNSPWEKGRSCPMSKFNIMETTVAKVHAAYLDGALTCR